MSWIEKSVHRAQVQEQEKQAQEEEKARRANARGNRENRKFQEKLGKELADLIKKNTGKRIEAPIQLAPVNIENLQGPKRSAGDGYALHIFGTTQVDGVSFGIAKASYIGKRGNDDRRWTALVMFGRDAYRLVGFSWGSVNKPVGLGQALIELGYGSAGTSGTSSSGDGYIGGTGPTRGPRPGRPR